MGNAAIDFGTFEPRPRLVPSLVEQFVVPQIERRFLGSKSMRFGPLLTTGLFLFETGAVLGRLFRRSAESFALVFSVTKDPKPAVDWMLGLGRKVDEAVPDASTLFELFLRQQMLKLGAEPASIEPAMWLASRRNERVPQNDVLVLTQLFANMGAGFGMACTERFESLYASSYQTIDAETWDEMYRYGSVDRPHPPEPVSLEARTKEARDTFMSFAQVAFPELVSKLSDGAE